MDSLNEILDRQIYDERLMNNPTEFITVGNNSESQSQSPLIPAENGSNHGESHLMQNLIASPAKNILNDGRKGSGCGSRRDSVDMVIVDLGQQNEQAVYPTGSRHNPRRLVLPLGLLPGGHEQECNARIASSPIDFAASDISLDSLTVETISNAVLPQMKQETKLNIINTRGQARTNSFSHTEVDSTIVNMSLGVEIDEMEDLSSEGGRSDDDEVTLNQHHQQLLQQQPHCPQRLHSHHQPHDETLNGQLQRSTQLDLALGGVHGEVLSVIVQAQEREKDLHEESQRDVNDDADADAEEEDEDDERVQLLSPVLDHSSYQTLTSVNDRLSPPEFSPTSYATLTPIQPLPPISTMSEKFAYSGHISGGDEDANSRRGGGGVPNGTETRNLSGDNVCISGNGNTSGCANNDCNSVPVLSIPLGNNHLALSVLSEAQSPFSSYEKLSSMISPPSHTYSTSPSSGLSGMVVSCDLQAHNAPGLPLNENGNKKNLSTHLQGLGHEDGHVIGHGHLNQQKQNHEQCHGLQLLPVTLPKQVVCLSPTRVIGENLLVSHYETPYSGSHHDHELVLGTTSSTSSTVGLQHSPTLSPHSVSGGSVLSMPLHSPTSVVNLPNVNNSMSSLSVVVSLTPTPPPPTELHKVSRRTSSSQKPQYFLSKTQEVNASTEQSSSNNIISSNLSSASHQTNSNLSNGFQGAQTQIKTSASSSPKHISAASGGTSRTSVCNDLEEINTKELAQRISAELKRYSIPQAIFAQRVLCRSQGTLSDLLRNPKPWSKLKSGRETFRRMHKWLQEPEFQRMSALRMAAAQIPQRAQLVVGTSLCSTSGSTALSPSSTVTMTVMDSNLASTISPNVSDLLDGSTASNAPGCNFPITSANCRRKEEPQIEHITQPKKPRLVFTDLQRRTLQAIFKETKRPSKEMQVTIARQLGLEPTTVGNFFMNARRRSMDKWRDDDIKNQTHLIQNRQQERDGQDEDRIHSLSQTQCLTTSNNHSLSNSLTQDSYAHLHPTALSPLETFNDEADMELELESHDFDLEENHGNSTEHQNEML
ncbi:homeobox protein onecut isoform X1 [Drosophila bipectinata]|uniref:homeobox protein onecut isoform X1 n=1 Tax=Drosophila bipectinata TaxID=42026 RepID=UPI001C8A4AB6|nr:homeobox protein onecut isoform X1 [Drosophila bipectinata]